MWESGQVGPPGTGFSWLHRPFASNMTSGEGNRSERYCLFQVWSAVRLAWEMQEVRCKNWFIYLISLHTRSHERKGDLTDRAHLGRIGTISGLGFLSSGEAQTWAELVSKVTALIICKSKMETPPSRSLGLRYPMTLDSAWRSPRQIPRDGSNDMNLKHMKFCNCSSHHF